MRTKLTKLRFWVVGPFLFYLLIFLLWFPRWQQAPHSLSTRLLGVLFAGMTAVLMAAAAVGGFFTPLGGGPVVDIAIRIYEHFRDDSKMSVATSRKGTAAFSALNPPALVVTKRLKDRTPVRGACPLCEVEFSTEAFDCDGTYPHEITLNKWYEEHFQDHLSENSE